VYVGSEENEFRLCRNNIAKGAKRIVYIKEIMMLMMRMNVMTRRRRIKETSEGTPVEYVFLLL
jgi:hypothetical protein